MSNFKLFTTLCAAIPHTHVRYVNVKGFVFQSILISMQNYQSHYARLLYVDVRALFALQIILKSQHKSVLYIIQYISLVFACCTLM